MRLKNRKGVFVVLFGILIMVLMGTAAMSIDMSRIWTMRNELQTSADAAALAGAIQLTTPHNPGAGPTYQLVLDSATAYAQFNKAQYSTPQVDSVTLGDWNDATQVFTPGIEPPNAVYVVVSHNTNKLIIAALGIAAPRVHARATAWANAPINIDNCLRPWSIPYVVLMAKVNEKRVVLAAGDPKYNLPYGDGPRGPQNLTRPFTDLDREVLNGMTEAEREFNLKVGAGNENQSTVNDPPPGSEEPGQYQAVKLPRKRSAAGVENPDGEPPNGGADAYRDAIEGRVCYPIGVGDVLEVQTGNIVGPTVDAIERQNNQDTDYVCNDLVDNNGSNPVTHGDCINDQGTVGVDVKSAFHLCFSGCNGAAEVTVQLIGSFTLLKVYPDADNPGNAWEKSQIRGRFKPIAGTGPIGPGPTTLRRIILVR